MGSAGGSPPAPPPEGLLQLSGSEESSVWVRLFHRIGVRWTKDLDFVLVPFGCGLALAVLALLEIAGQHWAAIALHPLALMAVAAGNVVWALLALREQEGTLGEGGVPTQNRRVHDAWRARTVAWDVLVVAIVGIFVAALVWAGPDHFLPESDLPVIELSVLVVTVVLLATFARYTAMAFSTDVDSLVRRLEGIARRESEERRDESARVAGAFEREIGKLLERIDRQIEATQLGLRSVTDQLEAVSEALASQARAGEQLAAERREATQALQRAEAAASAREAARRREEAEAALRRREQIRPVFVMRLLTEGSLFHRVVLELENRGGRAQGTTVEVRHRLGVVVPRAAPPLASGARHRVDLGDVSEFDLRAAFDITVTTRDDDGTRYAYAGAGQLARRTGFWGQTKQLTVAPAEWTRMSPT